MIVTEEPSIAVEERPVEVVERKGLGHPDTICDALAERLSLALSRCYFERFGCVLHHNVDKALLWAGSSRPSFGGGEVLRPIEIFLAGRAITELAGERIPLEELAQEQCRDWFQQHCHALDPERHVRLRSLISPGSADLVDLFSRQRASGVWLANDTSCGVGYAPFSPLETLVYRAEKYLTSREHIAAHPEIGEDVKVMGVRHGSRMTLTVACAFVDRFVPDLDTYMSLKNALAERLAVFAAQTCAADVQIEVNPADAPERGSVYLTVTGTSAECGDDGEAGRGNRVNGLITPFRPMTMESAAGKNAITHVGKLYNLAAGEIAAALVREVEPITHARCCLVSQIGRPICEPQLIEISLRTEPPGAGRDLTLRVEEIARRELAGIDGYWRRLLDGRLGIDRWPISESP